MKTLNTLEELFLVFSDLVVSDRISYQQQDYKPVTSFRTLLLNGTTAPTQKQAKFMLILLNKYSKQLSSLTSTDINYMIENLPWGVKFREIDYSKTITLDKDASGLPQFNIKFPYSLKEEFDSLGDGSVNRWDPEKKVRKVYPLEINPVKLMDFASKYNFTMDPVISDFYDKVEEIWDRQDEICPHSTIENGSVKLQNALPSTLEYYQQRMSGNISKDLLLARTLGHFYNGKAETPLEKISQTHYSNLFHIEVDDAVDIINKTDATVLIMLDRQEDFKNWIEKFIDSCNKVCYNIEKIRVCFRTSNKSDEGKEFNQWVKDLKLGGSIDTGNIFIFKHTFSKWVFEDFNADIVMTNTLYAPSNMNSNHYIMSHPTVLFVGEHKPSLRKENNKIVSV